MSFLEERKALTREKRVSALSHFDGTLDALIDESQGTEIKQKIRTFSQVSYDEILYAVSVLSRIGQAAVIVHGAIGCSASGIYYHKEGGYPWYSTNLNERDTILGGDEKLRKAVLRACEEHQPKVIFIVGTPVVAINNDDINSIILELEEELNVKLVSIYTDGFKTKAPVSGYDIVTHSLLHYVVDREGGFFEQKKDFINVITFSENKENLAAVLEILRDLDITYHLLPQYTDIDTIAEAGQARASVALSEEDGAYFAEELESVFQVPYVRTKAPVGLRATRHFIRKLAKELGVEAKAEAYIRTKEAQAQQDLKKSILADKRVFLEQSLETIPGFVEIIENLGGRVEGIAIPYLDLINQENLKKLKSLKASTPVVIANGQPFEVSNILSKKDIDYYIGGKTAVSFAAEQGSIPLSTAKQAVYGYKGIFSLTEQLKQSAAFLPVCQKTIYKDSWLKKSSNWYVKQEVK